MTAKSIVFFNNKGGVGKTTLACNISSVLARTHSKRVLVIDCDPQCNATQLILDDNDWTRIYDTPSTTLHTIYDVLKPLERGDATSNVGVSFMPPDSNRFGVSVLPGHPRVSVLEDELSRAWQEVQAAKLGGFRRTSWLFALLRRVQNDYDFVIVDVGPSLGSLNRSVLLSADYFITPMGPDIFSIIGVRNIADWLVGWRDAYRLSKGHYTSSGQTFDGFDVVEEPKTPSGFLGYTVLQYVTKTIRGERRPTQAFERIISRIPSEILTHFGRFIPPTIARENLRLGDVPSMYSIVAMAQDAHAPIGNLNTNDGLNGTQSSQQTNYAQMMNGVCTSLLRNMST